MVRRDLSRRAGSEGGRGTCTAIYFLLEAGQRSHWHRVDATEIWLWHAGAPLRARDRRRRPPRDDPTRGAISPPASGRRRSCPPSAWQSAEPLGAWTLLSCVVAPAFEFSGFELAAPGWAPPA